MDSYKSRPKINPKIIFNYLLPDTKKALIIGNNNSDIIEILKELKNIHTLNIVSGAGNRGNESAYKDYFLSRLNNEQ